MVYCCVPHCKQGSRKKSQGVTFHEFPSRHPLRQIWIKRINRKGDGKNKWQPKDRTNVCSNHFLPSDFKPNLKIRKLKPDAVPSIFEHCSPSKRIGKFFNTEKQRSVIRSASKAHPLKANSDEDSDASMANDSCQDDEENDADIADEYCQDNEESDPDTPEEYCQDDSDIADEYCEDNENNYVHTPYEHYQDDADIADEYCQDNDPNTADEYYQDDENNYALAPDEYYQDDAGLADEYCQVDENNYAGTPDEFYQDDEYCQDNENYADTPGEYYQDDEDIADEYCLDDEDNDADTPDIIYCQDEDNDADIPDECFEDNGADLVGDSCGENEADVAGDLCLDVDDKIDVTSDICEVVEGDNADICEVVEGNNADIAGDICEVVEGDNADICEVVEGNNADICEVVEGDNADICEVVEGDNADICEVVEGNNADAAGDICEVVEGNKEDIAGDICEVVEGDNADIAGASCQSNKGKRDISMQTKLTGLGLASKSKQIRTLQRSCNRAKTTISLLRKEREELMEKLKELEETILKYNLDEIETASSDGNITAMFILEQLRAFSQTKSRWSDLTMRHCLSWRRISPVGYAFIRDTQLLSVPSESALKRYKVAKTKPTATGIKTETTDAE